MPQPDDSLLGPSNSSDTGSDRAGAARQPGLPDPQTPVDTAVRDDAPRSPLPDQVMSIESDKTGNGAEDIAPELDPENGAIDEDDPIEEDADVTSDRPPSENEGHPS